MARTQALATHSISKLFLFKQHESFLWTQIKFKPRVGVTTWCFQIIFVVCHARVDLGFVVEASASLEKHGKGNFRRILDFVEITIRKFSISRSKARVGVVTYGAKTDLVFDFER